MENDNNIKRIIQLYFGKHFSRSGRVLFGREDRYVAGLLGTFAGRSDCRDSRRLGCPAKTFTG